MKIELSLGGWVLVLFLSHCVFCTGNGNWGCAKVYGRGTLYMKWGQEKQRFAKMRLRGEKEKKGKTNKILNYENIRKYDKIKISKNHEN